MFLTARDVLVKGLKCVGYDYCAIAKLKNKALVKRFKAHFEYSSLVIAEMWYNLCQGDVAKAKLPKEDKNVRGFKRFLHAHYWLFTRPKNRFISMSHFGLSGW